MSRILRLSDRVKLKIGDVVFYLAPLSYLHKQYLASCTKIVDGEEHYDLLKAQAYYIKHSLKEVEGIKCYDDSEYKLEFEGDSLTDDCVSEILSLEQRTDLNMAAWQILNGISEITNPVDGKPLETVELEVVSKGK